MLFFLLGFVAAWRPASFLFMVFVFFWAVTLFSVFFNTVDCMCSSVFRGSWCGCYFLSSATSGSFFAIGVGVPALVIVSVSPWRSVFTFLFSTVSLDSVKSIWVSLVILISWVFFMLIEFVVWRVFFELCFF